jgi:hypothetical protein
MATRTVGKTKLTPEVRQRLAAVAAEARQLVYGAKGCPEWGTTFAEIEADAREVGHEFMRLLMAQANTQQAQEVPDSALQTEAGEEAIPIGSEDRTLETEAGGVSWKEPKAYLPQSRKAFFPSVEGVGAER